MFSHYKSFLEFIIAYYHNFSTTSHPIYPWDRDETLGPLDLTITNFFLLFIHQFINHWTPPPNFLYDLEPWVVIVSTSRVWFPYCFVMELVKHSLEFTHRRRKWVILLALCGFSSYGVYKVYHLPSVSKKRKRFVKLLGALVSIAEMVSDSAETLSVVSKDLKEFLESDTDQIPISLKQLSKLAVSNEFLNSLSRVSEAVTVGVIRGYYVSDASNEIGKVENSSFTNQIMDRLMSKAGTGFVSVVVGSFARNLVLGFYSNEGLNGHYNSGLKFAAKKSSASPQWMELLCSDKCRLVMADCIKTFVSTAVAIYLDKTSNINVFDDMFSGMTDPKHEKQVRDLLVSICNGAVETVIKSSHQVLTSSKSPKSPNPSVGYKHSLNGIKDKISWPDTVQSGEKTHFDIQNSGWVNTVSSTLSVPSNRRFMLDVTGRVTFETIRSIIRFFLWKISEVVGRSFNVLQDEVLGRGLEVVNYVGAKSSVIVTICLALYLHILGGTRAFLSA